MQSLWSDSEAADYVRKYGPKWGEHLALRVYTSRLIGRDPNLVMHGGGNTSLKGQYRTLLGDTVEALYVKGSGSDLDSIEPEGLPAVDLTHLRRLRALDSLSDEEMVNQIRTHLFDASAPNPSVETLLHAFLPHRFIDHTHADIALVVTNQTPEKAEELVREAFEPRFAVVPYIMPGFALAKLAAQVYERNPNVEGLVLLNHGLFSFGDDARTAYERMIAAVDCAERVARNRVRARAELVTPSPATTETIAALAPILRGTLAESTGRDNEHKRVILEFRSSEAILRKLAETELPELALRGPLTPDHIIRTKASALLLTNLPTHEEALTNTVRAAVEDYRGRYNSYFEANRQRSRTPPTKLDPSPRVILVPGLGLFASGRTRKDAIIAADIAEHTLAAKSLAQSIGKYVPLSDGDLFDMEYWSLEQAKLGKAKDPILAGQLALVTGAVGAIGMGICRKLIEAGAHVVLTDLDAARLETAVAELDPKKRGVALAIPMDVTDEGAVRAAFAEVCRKVGGLDIVVLNAGIAHVASVDKLDVADFQRVLDVNLRGAFLSLREAARLLKRQGTGGNIILNSSKNVFGPGADFGAYSASKAAAHQLSKVAAIELASSSVRVNMINADAVFGDDKRPSGLWQEVGPARAQVRGIDVKSLPDYYRQRNLLKVAVTPDHVGNAVVFFASNQTPTTGATLPVDGGVVDAFPR